MLNCQDFRLVTRADVAQMFGVCVKTVDNYIKDGLLPQPVQFASREYWHPDDIRSFMDATFKRTSSQPLTLPAQTPDETRAPLRSARTPTGATPKPATGSSRDIHPTARAKARQHSALQRLNAQA